MLLQPQIHKILDYNMTAFLSISAINLFTLTNESDGEMYSVSPPTPHTYKHTQTHTNT